MYLSFFNRATRRLCSAAALQKPKCLETPGPFVRVMHDRKEKTAKMHDFGFKQQKATALFVLL